MVTLINSAFMKIILRLLVVLFFIWPTAKSASAQIQGNSLIYEGDTAWVNAQLRRMSLDEKLGQLFMVAAYSNKGKAHEQKMTRLIREEHVGGLIFFQGSTERQLALTQQYQQAAALPLLIGQDAEWGLQMRLEDGFQFPWPLTVGAIRDTQLSYAYGKAIGEHCRRLGVRFNFGPVVDVNTNPDNPIINARSFGETPWRVARHAQAYMSGLQEAGVLACAKHFPGHGDTDKDSHKTLPQVNHSLAHLRNIELYPYRELADTNLAAVMAAHLEVPALDPSGKPTSLSKPALDYLRQEVGFDGLAVTDALNMRGVTDSYEPGEVELEAFQAGHDILLFPRDVGAAKAALRKALKRGRITDSTLTARVRRILLAKSALGLPGAALPSSRGLKQDLSREEDRILNRRLFAKATTVLINHQKALPIKELSDKRFAVVTAGPVAGETFVKTLKNYAPVDHYAYQKGKEQQLLAHLAPYDKVIFGIFTANDNPWQDYKVDRQLRAFINQVSLQNELLIDLFANPYSLRDFPEAQEAQGLVLSYQSHSDAQSVSAQIIFGALGASGQLPVTVGPQFSAGFGLTTPSLGRLGYALPGEVGMNAHKLQEVHQIMREAIGKRATPGGQILVARKGKVILNQSYGHHTYQASRPVSSTDIYDLASVTKIAATLPVLMRLVEDNKVDLDQTLGTYLPSARGTNKEQLVIRDILAHQARLKPWIPFYKKTLNSNGRPADKFYASQRSFDFPWVVAPGIYARRDMRDSIMHWVLDSPLRHKKEYKYSDLGYYLLLELIENITGQKLNILAHNHLYNRLGAYTMAFHPRRQFGIADLVPTERDDFFRHRLLQGYVHDQGSAMLGGVGGHAGLFSNANDLAKLMQMYLQKGQYAGVRYFDSVTVNEFVRCQFCEDDNRRGIGFDKPQLEGPGPTCGCLSRKSFGHSGFTGILAWADPEEEIVYIFLSNRVYPDASNRKLISLDIRTRIQKAIYEAIESDSTSRLLSDNVPLRSGTK